MNTILAFTSGLFIGGACGILTAALLEAGRDRPKESQPKEPQPREAIIPMRDTDIRDSFKCCENCNNNPRNNPYASGICMCALPAMERAGTTGTPGEPRTTVTFITNQTTTNPQK